MLQCVPESQIDCDNRRDLPLALLQYVSQFVCNKCLAITTQQVEMSSAEEDVLPGCECPRPRDPVELVGSDVGVNANPAEVSAHGLFHGARTCSGRGWPLPRACWMACCTPGRSHRWPAVSPERLMR